MKDIIFKRKKVIYTITMQEELKFIHDSDAPGEDYLAYRCREGQINAHNNLVFNEWTSFVRYMDIPEGMPAYVVFRTLAELGWSIGE